MEDYISLVFIGDVVGRPGLDFLKENIGNLKQRYNANLLIANGENAAQGKGITEEEATELFDMGIHIITTGNHVWDNWKGRPLLAANSAVLRPHNMPPGNPGKSINFYKVEDEFEVAVMQLQGRTFMQTIDCPFRSADHALKIISERTKNIIVDFHADATAEKMAMGWHLDGRVSAVIGTHTHIQTADSRILPNGTAYITDVGMSGPYESVVGLKKEIALKRYILQTAHKYEMAVNDVRIAGVNVKIDVSTGKAFFIEAFTLPPFETSREIL